MAQGEMDTTVVQLIVGKIDDVASNLGERIDNLTRGLNENTTAVKITNGQIVDLKDWRTNVVTPIIKSIQNTKKSISRLVYDGLNLISKIIIIALLIKFLPSITKIYLNQ